ncbi:hypothetical protein [Streptomyces sp. NPDC051993]|uniref:hypothetical protein n=1 Tax=Streptomyces sp. NPDC051993 TaxID=3155286 RepID=UPI003412C861
MGGPIVLAELYRAVIDRTKGMCACTGQCGQTHKTSGGACDRRGRYGHPLLVVPVDPATSPVEAAALGPEELVALCGGCAVRRASAQKKRREAELDEQAEAVAISLF